MYDESSTPETAGQIRPRWDRMRSAELVVDFETARRAGVSQREFSKMNGVPRTTLQHWLSRKANLDADPAVIAFFESPAGLAFLHRLVGALHFVFGLVGLGGVDLVCTFLKLTGLDAFVAASHGEQHGVAATMTEQTVTFGAQQRERLASRMAPRTIALAEDETFPEGVLLEAMEPVSGFILHEKDAPDREAATWTAAVEDALAGMPVKIAVMGGDEAAGLAAHARQMEAHHAPDLFHVQHPLWQALARPLIRSLESPAEALAEAKAHSADWRERQACHERGERPVGRPPDYARHVACAEAAEDEARQVYETAAGYKQGAYAAIRSLGTVYHPVDPATGELRGAEQVGGDLDEAMATIDDAATAIDLTEPGRRLIDKARRVVPKMVATIAFFHEEVSRQLETLALSSAVADYARSVLVPAAYLARLAQRAQTVAERAVLQETRQALLDRADAACFLALSNAERLAIEHVALTCVDLFVRSTSCVEGRKRTARAVVSPPPSSLSDATGGFDRHPQLLDPET